MSFIIDLIVFNIGIFLANIIFFIELKKFSYIETINYLKNFNNIYISYLLTISLKLISTSVAVFYRIIEGNTLLQKAVSMLSCLFLSPITFSFFFVFFLAIQFTVYLLLSTDRLKQSTSMKNIVFVIMSILSMNSINWLNTYLSKITLKNETINTIFVNTLPLQNYKISI